MTKMRTLTSLIAAIVLFASCKQYEKAPSGLTYRIEHGNGKEKIKQGDFVKLHVEYRLKSKDSLLQGSFDNIPMYLPYDTSRMSKHTIVEIMGKCAAGDKVDFALSIDTLKNLGMIDYNETFRQGDLISGKMEILKVFKSQDEVKADYVKEIDLEKQREILGVKDYAAKKGYKTVSTSSGIQIEVQQQGQGPKADSGQQVSIMYRGYFIGKKNTGVEFDGNMGKKGPEAAPIQFVLGTGSVIPAWEEALKYFAKGGKGRILVPSMLAYGQQGSAPVIPPFANLGFDIEIVDITAAPAQPAQPVAPNGQPAAAPKGK